MKLSARYIVNCAQEKAGVDRAVSHILEEIAGQLANRIAVDLTAVYGNDEKEVAITFEGVPVHMAQPQCRHIDARCTVLVFATAKEFAEAARAYVYNGIL